MKVEKKRETARNKCIGAIRVEKEEEEEEEDEEEEEEADGVER